MPMIHQLLDVLDKMDELERLRNTLSGEQEEIIKELEAIIALKPKLQLVIGKVLLLSTAYPSF